MEKTITIGNKDVRLCNNVSWAIIYRDQFGRDIIPSLMPMLAGVLDIFAGLINETGKTDEISLGDLAKLADGDALINAMIHVGGFEFVDLIKITWALAKCVDDNIPDPKTWVKGFDSFPVDVVAPAVFELIFKGVISSKNLKRLEDLTKRIQPTLISTQSSSPESKED